MNLNLSSEDLATLMTSLEYSLRAVRDAPDTPYEVRRQNVQKLDKVIEKLRSLPDSE